MSNHEISLTKPELTVLHLEDNPFDARLVSFCLEEAFDDLTLYQVKTRKEFLKGLESESFDIILSDYNVPEFNNTDALDLASAICPDVPFIYVTGALGEKKAVNVLKAGATDYVIKGNLDKLPLAIIRALKEAEQREQKALIEEQIKSQNRLFKELQRVAEIVIWEYDFEDEETYWSEEAASIFGMEYEDLPGFLDSIEYYKDEFRSKIRDVVSAARSWKMKWDLDAVLITDLGEEKWVRLIGYPVIENERIVKFRGLIMDIDSRKQISLELKEKHIESLKYQSMLLSTQINPHFIFNALNSVQLYILDQNVEPALNFLSDFSVLMRGMLNNSMKSYIPLKAEIEWLSKYMDIEKIRFSDKFDYSFEIADDVSVEEFMIPTMLLQPFVENAILHGIGPMESGGMITISFERDEEYIMCIIDDNGVGREEAGKLKSTKEEVKRHKSYGVNITKTKIEVLSDLESKKFDYHVEDKMGKDGTPEGTAIHISFPLMIKKDL